MRYAFIRDYQHELPVQSMRRVFKINRSGYYAWRQRPVSDRGIEDERLLKRIKVSYIASGGTYGSPWIHRDLRDDGESLAGL